MVNIKVVQNNVSYLQKIFIYIQGVAEMRDRVKFFFLNGSPCIFLQFRFSCKIPSIMMCHLSIFNCWFRSYKQLKVDVFATLKVVDDKSVREK